MISSRHLYLFIYLIYTMFDSLTGFDRSSEEFLSLALMILFSLHNKTMPTRKNFGYKGCSYGLANFKFLTNLATLF